MQKISLNKTQLINIFAFIITVLIASISNIILKYVSNKLVFTTELILLISSNYLLILGYILYLIPAFLTIYLYKFYKVGFVQSIVASIYVVTPLIAFALGIEMFNIVILIGIVLVFGGVTLIVKEGGKNELY